MKAKSEYLKFLRLLSIKFHPMNKASKYFSNYFKQSFENSNNNTEKI